MAKPTLEESDNIYFENEIGVETFPSGCTGLNLVLGGGWAQGRVLNLVGRESTGKTQLAIEGMVNYHLVYPKRYVHYEDAEHAFDRPYANVLGLPDSDFIHIPEDNNIIRTVEELGNRIEKFVELVSKKSGGLFIVDSLDALSTEADLKAGVGAASYGTAKAKMMSDLFRHWNGPLAKKNITFMVISQVRDKINAGPFEPKETRSGGKALNFYSSQIVWLNSMGKIEKSVKGIKRDIGVRVRARTKKNKCAPNFREFEFPILFNYGIEDLTSLVEWLSEVKSLDLIEKGLKDDDLTDYIKQANKLPYEDYQKQLNNVQAIVRKRWLEIEESFKPKRHKYNEG